MVITTYLKTLWRMFKKHVTRLLSIIFMVLISVGFISGIGSTTDKINYSLTDYYNNRRVCDIILKSTDGTPLDEAALISTYGEDNVNFGFSYETEGEDGVTRYYFIDFPEWTLNKVDFIEGEESDGVKVYAERPDKKINGYRPGEEAAVRFPADVPFPEMQMEVCGVVQSPLTFGQDGEPSWIANENLSTPDVVTELNKLTPLVNIIYVPISANPLFAYLPHTDAYIALSGGVRSSFAGMSSQYKSAVNAEKTKLLEEYGVGVQALTLFDNYSFKALKSYGDKVMYIGYVLMVAFMLVTALVVLSTMTRLIEEERQQVACLKTQGYSDFGIITKYLFFALIGTGIGGFGAYFVGLGISRLIYKVFNYTFAMPPISSHVAMVFYIVVFSIIVVATLAATAFAGLKLTHKTPAELLRPKSPRPGKKVVIERIPFIWNRLSFKYKSTVRNVLRYKSRFVMTVLAVAISMALVMAGLTLLDICLFRGVESISIMMVSIVIVVFAGLLTAVVIYTLTNINVSERNRELATLMVLGYQDREVAWYIYREILIDVALGIILGYPLSAAIMAVLFSIMAVGTYATMMWAVAPFVIFAFTFMVMLLLRRKIVKINMNESLKAIE